MHEAICPECLSKIPSRIGGGRRKRFCGADCRRAFHGRIGDRLAKEKSMERRAAGKVCQCGTFFTLSKGNEKFCSKECRLKSSRPGPPKCTECGSEFRKSNPRQKTCGKSCRRTAARRRSRRPDIVLCTRIRSSMRRYLREGKGGQSWECLVGYSRDDLRRHLERSFAPGMSWKNMSKWHIDHIRPLASFNICEAGDAEFVKAWALSNLQPLWAKANLSKGARYAVP